MLRCAAHLCLVGEADLDLAVEALGRHPSWGRRRRVLLSLKGLQGTPILPRGTAILALSVYLLPRRCCSLALLQAGGAADLTQNPKIARCPNSSEVSGLVDRHSVQGREGRRAQLTSLGSTRHNGTKDLGVCPRRASQHGLSPPSLASYLHTRMHATHPTHPDPRSGHPRPRLTQFHSNQRLQVGSESWLDTARIH